MKRRWMIALLMAVSTTLAAQDMARPWTFWYWMYGAVSEEGIRADLQAMKDVGLGGCYLMPIKGPDDKAAAALPPIEKHEAAAQLSPTFWKMVDVALQQADSLRLQMGIHICDGFALAGGPWIRPEESMQRVVWSDTVVTVNSRKITCILPQPQRNEGYYEDIAAFAVRAECDLPAPHISGTIARDENGSFRTKEAGYIQYDFDCAQTVRSLLIVPNGNNIQSQRLLVQASDDGITYRNIRQLQPPRQGWQNTDSNYTYALPQTTARHFRFFWTPEGTEPGSEDLDAAKWSPVLKIKELRLSAEPRIDQYESKNASVWRIATQSAETAPQQVETIRLTLHGDTLSATLPKGRWRILRFGHTSTGHQNATAGGGKGLECDKFSPVAVNKQVDGWFAQFMKRPHAGVIKYMHVDSWECGSQNWGHRFAEEFKQRRGYDLLPYMPVYAGVPMNNDEQVLRDIRTTVNDLINDVFFATIRQRAQAYGVQLSSESVAPTMVSDGMEHYKYADIPMGEFWLNSPTHDKPNDMLDAISGAHVYGKNIVQAEGFTEVRGVWDETPAGVKQLLDRNFALGMNRLFFHVFTHNPWLNRKPGMTLDGIGLFFQRDQTWFPEARAFVDYITRCQKLLQTGQPVADIAVYTGEEMPRRALTPDRLVPMLPGLFGKERVEAEQERLANAGCPMEESPVGVRHSAGIPDLKDWINPLHGYQYDSMNKDALLNRPFSYKVLVVPEGLRLSDETIERINALRRQGVVIVDKPHKTAAFNAIAPDVVLPDGIAYTHRQDAATDIYFIANQQDAWRTANVSFRIDNGHPVVYNPVTDAYSRPAYRSGERTEVSLTLPPSGSLFVIFGQEEASLRPTPALLKETEIGSSAWQIAFEENGQTVHTPRLFDWSRHENDSIRYYSGHVSYTTSFKNKGKGAAKLSLGDVRDIAHVWVNGQDCGIIWTAPYEADITKALRKGRNTVQIRVVNTWHNALRGADRGCPPYGGIWTNANYRTKGDQLLPAGLLGPVVLKTEK